MLDPRTWFYVTVRELEAWIGLVVMNSLHSYPSFEKYYSTDFAYEMRQVPHVMSKTRFMQIKRFLHVSKDEKRTPDDPLGKIRPLLVTLLEACQDSYNPHREVSIDEMDVPFKGRCRFKSRINYKRAGDGFLVYALCDASNGYTYSFQVSFDSTVPNINADEGKLANAVYNLTSKLKSKWHVVVTDNLYTSVKVANTLYSMQQLFLGTCRLNRGFPRCISMVKATSKRAHEENKGKMVSKSKGNVLALAYYDNKPVHFLSTAHIAAQMVEKERDVHIPCGEGTYRKTTIVKELPNVVRDYNMWMDGVDVADQLRSYYDSKLKSHKWWHTFFFGPSTQQYLMLIYCIKENVQSDHSQQCHTRAFDRDWRNNWLVAM